MKLDPEACQDRSEAFRTGPAAKKKEKSLAEPPHGWGGFPLPPEKQSDTAFAGSASKLGLPSGLDSLPLVKTNWAICQTTCAIQITVQVHVALIVTEIAK